MTWHNGTRALLAAGLTIGLAALSGRPAGAQGCVASRMEAPSCTAAAHRNVVAEGVNGHLETYNLQKGKWQTSFGYRSYRSHRHFVGSVEQNAENVANGTAERDRAGTEVINHVYNPTFGVTYGVTDRLSVSADLPYFHALRRSPWSGSRPTYTTSASGISDLIVTGRYWVADPKKHMDQNLSLGLGLKFPTGNDRVEDDFLVALDPNGGRITDRRPVDQSIQPGDGGYGFVVEMQAFKTIGRVAAYANGSYLFNPKEQNDFLRNGPSTNPDPTNMYLSIADQFAARLGVATALSNRIGVSLGARLEGVPSSDLIGGDMGRRRPGYSIAIEPGVSYTWDRYSVGLSVPWLVRRVRTQNISDKLESAATGEHVNGDAAFADVVVILGFTTRF